MGAFEDFVNANLGVRMPLYIDTTTPDVSSKAAGSLGSKYVDSSTNFLYEKTGFTNADWIKIAELGDSRGGGGGSITLSGGYNIDIDQAGSAYTINLADPFTGTFRVQDAQVIGTGSGIPFAVSESGQVGLNLFTGENQLIGFITPYHLHVSGVTALSGSQDLNFATKPALTVFGNSEIEDGGLYPASMTTAERNALSLLRGGSGALIYNSDSNQLEINNGSTWRTLSGGALGSGVGAVANIGAGSGIASGVVDDTASFKSLIGGTNLQILGDENSLTLNVTGVSGADGSGVSSFTGLSDTPSSFEANQFLRVSSDATGLIYNDLSGIITSETLDWLNYTNFSDLPNATYHHGMFAHVHSEGAAYMAHAGGWTKIYPLVTGAEGLGDGSGVFKEISSYNLQFKSLLGGDNVRITGDGSTLTFDVTGISGGSTTGITGATNLGAGSGLISGITDNDLQVKSLVGGTNLQITGDGESLYLNVTGVSGSTASGITGVESLGAGSALASGVSGSDLYLKSLVGGTNVTLSSDDNTITINASAGGGGGGTGEVCITGTGPASLPKVKARSNFAGRLPDVIYGLFTAGSYRTACYFTSIEDEGQANDRIFYHPLESSAGFPYVAFENDSTGAFKLAVEVTAETGSDGENLSLQQYIDNGHAAFYNSGCGAGGGGGGTGITGATNLGAGSGLISGITDNDLQVKSLVGGTNLQITGDGESLYLNVTGVSGSTVSGITGASNIGTGSGVFSGISNNNLVFRTIQAGPNVTIDEIGSGLRITASTTNVTVTGGSVSGGLGSNPFITGESNYYSKLPDQIILTYAPNGHEQVLDLVQVGPTYIYYTYTSATTIYLTFNNDSEGSYSSFNGSADYGPKISISGYVSSGRGVYLGGGGSSSSSSTTGITGASNIGTGSGILSGISDNDLVFRTIEAGPNVNITESSSGLKISATTSAFVSGGNVSGGVGSNPFISGYSNFYTTLPDEIILQSAAPDGSPPIPYTLNFFDANPYIYYENTAAGSYSIARFDNDSFGSNGTFLGTAYHPNPLGSLSGLIGSGRGVYLGGGGSGSSSSTAGNSTSGINNSVIDSLSSAFIGSALPNAVLVSGIGGSAGSVLAVPFMGVASPYLMYRGALGSSVHFGIDFNHDASGTLNNDTNCSTPYSSLQEMIDSGYALYY